MRVQADAVLAGLSRGLSGGGLLNICVNAIYAGSVEPDSAKWLVTQGDAGAGDQEGAEGEGGALRGEGGDRSGGLGLGRGDRRLKARLLLRGWVELALERGRGVRGSGDGS